MKFYKNILIILAILFMGCDEEFLNRPSLDDITADTYWKTANDFNLYIIDYYRSLPGWESGEWSGGIYWSDDNSDDMIQAGITGRLAGTNTISTGNGSWNYGSVRGINYFLSQYESTDVPLSEIQQYVGEGFFFRAHTYFNLVKTYGAVPWIDEPLAPDSELLYAERTPRNEMIDNIIADLDKAIEYLPSGTTSNGNRLNKETAMLFKARIALYEGTWEKYHANTPFGVTGSDGTSFLQLAATTAEEIMDNPGGFGIYNTGNPMEDYRVLFNQTEYTGNPEVMVWRDYDASLGIAHNGQRYLPRIGGGRGITKNLVDEYLCTDGLPISVSPLYQGDDGLLNVSADRDPRLAQSIFLPGDPMIVNGTEVVQAFEKAPIDQGGSSLNTTGYMIYKGSNPDIELSRGANMGTTSSPVFRFAEVLLIFAEAKAELGTITQGDLDNSINILRARVNMPSLVLAGITPDPNWSFPDLSPIINEIRRERHIELGIEGYRFDDIMRWQAADELVIGKRYKGAIFIQSDYPEMVIGSDVLVDDNGYIDPHQLRLPGGNGFVPERDYLLAVPLDEITKNPNLTQNPGWTD